MYVEFDDKYQALPDYQVEKYVQEKLNNYDDIYTSQMLVIDVLRGKLCMLPVDERPTMDWVFYGKEVIFDKDVRSSDRIFNDEKLNVHERALYNIIFPITNAGGMGDPPH